MQGCAAASGPPDVHAGGLQMGSDANSKLKTWRGRAEKACTTRKDAIQALVTLLKACFTFPEKRPDMWKVADDLGNIAKDLDKIQQSCKLGSQSSKSVTVVN